MGVPSTAIVHAGLARTPDGALYVEFANSSPTFTAVTAGTITATTITQSPIFAAPSAVSGSVLIGSTATSSNFMAIKDAGVTLVRDAGSYGWVSGDNPNGSSGDTALSRVAAGIIGVGTGAAGNGGGALFFSERTAPSAPAANGVYIYAVDNGGKTELLARFNSGAAQRIAIEP